MDGADGGAVFFDSAALANWSNSGAVTKTGIKKLGTASGLFTASSISRIARPVSSIGNFGTDDFTVEGFLYVNTLPTTSNNYGFAITNDYAGASGRGWQINVNGDSGGKLSFSVYPGATTSYSTAISGAAPLSIHTWYHVAMCRVGSTLYAFQDGVLLGTATILGGPSLTIGDGAAGTLLGTINNWQTIWAFDGYIDEVRITRGVGRYTSSFTPPTAPFPDHA